MRIHKARHEHASAGVEGRFAGIRGFEFGSGPDRDDLFIVHHNRAIFDDAEVAEVVSTLGTALQGEELGGGVDEHGGNW